MKQVRYKIVWGEPIKCRKTGRKKTECELKSTYMYPCSDCIRENRGKVKDNYPVDDIGRRVSIIAPQNWKGRGFSMTQKTAPGQIETKDIFNFIKDYIEENGYAPVYREIAQGVYVSISTVKNKLVELEKQGYIERKPRSSRAITLLKESF